MKKAVFVRNKRRTMSPWTYSKVSTSNHPKRFINMRTLEWTSSDRRASLMWENSLFVHRFYHIRKPKYALRSCRGRFNVMRNYLLVLYFEQIYSLKISLTHSLEDFQAKTIIYEIWWRWRKRKQRNDDRKHRCIGSGENEERDENSAALLAVISKQVLESFA